MKCYNAFTGQTVDMPTTPTLHSLRSPARYWIVSDAQLKRDLKGRTLKDVYRDNHAGRMGGDHQCQYSPRFGKYEPRQETISQAIRKEYLAWCASRNHEPHPASIDPDHPQNCHREKAPKRELVALQPVAMLEAA